MNTNEIMRVLQFAKASTLPEREKSLRNLAYCPRMPDDVRAELLRLAADCSSLRPISLQPSAASIAGIPEVHPGPDAELAPNVRRVILDWCEAWQRSDELLSKQCPLPGPLLFSGPPGTGKSTEVAAIAARLSMSVQLENEVLPRNTWKLYALHSWMIVGSYLGESASKLIKQTEAALRCGGLVLEEIDALAMQRGGETSASHENSRITIALMHLIENATAPVIFTTNRIDIIDPAVVRRCETVQFAEPLLDVKWRILVRRLGLDPHDAPEIRDRWPDLLRRDIKLGKYSLPTTQLSRPIVELVPLAHIARRRAALHGSDVLSTFAELLSQEPQS